MTTLLTSQYSGMGAGLSLEFLRMFGMKRGSVPLCLRLLMNPQLKMILAPSSIHQVLGSATPQTPHGGLSHLTCRQVLRADKEMDSKTGRPLGWRHL